jgi:hypothetical protein
VVEVVVRGEEHADGVFEPVRFALFVLLIGHENLACFIQHEKSSDEMRLTGGHFHIGGHLGWMQYGFDPLRALTPVEYLIDGLEEEVVELSGRLAVQIIQVNLVAVDPYCIEVAVAVQGYEHERRKGGKPQYDEQPLSDALAHDFLLDHPVCFTCPQNHSAQAGRQIYPYSDTSRTYTPNTRIYGYIKSRVPLSLATAKLRFYGGKFGQYTKVTL